MIYFVIVNHKKIPKTHLPETSTVVEAHSENF